MVKRKSGKKIRSKTKTKSKTKSKAKKQTARKAKVTSQPKASSRKVAGKKVGRAAKKKRSSKPANEIHSSEPSTLGGRIFPTQRRSSKGEVATRSAGQSGDVQGLSRRALADSESVEELLEEGQALEAATVRAIEDAPDPDEAEVTTHEVPEDDVPEEYTDED